MRYTICFSGIIKRIFCNISFKRISSFIPYYFFNTNLLNQENKVNEKISFEIPLLSEFIRDGEILKLSYDKYGINGVFEITSITYNFSMHKTIFTASLELEKVE